MAKKSRFCKLCGRKSFSVRLRKIEGGERKSHYVCKKCTDFLDTVKHPEPIVKLSKKVVKDLRDWNKWKRPQATMKIVTRDTVIEIDGKKYKGLESFIQPAHLPDFHLTRCKCVTKKINGQPE